MVSSWPKVSILWLNYNSISFINLALKSLQGIKDLNYPNYELILVDNNSKDGSFEIIKNYAEKEFGSKSKIIKLNRNLGFCGGNNVAYSTRDKNSKYIVLLNNDAIPLSDSLSRLVEAMEKNEQLGAAQGVILQHKSTLVDNWGFLMDELLLEHPVFRDQPLPHIKRDIYVTYTSGAYTIYRIDAIRTLYNEDKLFHNQMFAYFDDNIICLKMWNRSWTVKAIPFIAAHHKKFETFKKVSLFKFYLGIRNYLVLTEITNSRYKTIAKTYAAKNFLANLIKRTQTNNRTPLRHLSSSFIQALKDAKKLSRELKYNQEHVNLYKAPIIKIKPFEIPLSLTLGRWLTKKVSENIAKSSKNI